MFYVIKFWGVLTHIQWGPTKMVHDIAVLCSCTNHVNHVLAYHMYIHS